MRRTLFMPMVAGVAGVVIAAEPLAAQTVLVTGRPVSASVGPKDTLRYSFRADSNYILRLVAEQQPGNVTLRLIGPKNAVIGNVNGTVAGEEELRMVTTETGTHQLQVVAGDSVGGAFRLTLMMNERLAAEPSKRVDQLMSPWNRTNGPGAAVAVWRNGKTLFAKAYGMANLAYGIPFTVNTPTNIGSTSKQFTAFAVMLLVEEGKLSLDDDVRKYLPDLKDFGQKVTVRNLLTHTSGYREMYNSLVLAGRRIDEGDYVGREEFIPLVQRQPALQNAPGAEFNYNNTAFALAAMIVAKVSGVPFEQFMATRVFAPIGMTRTQVHADVRVPVKGATVGYSRSNKGIWRDLGDLGASMGAGGIYTTLGDLQKWAEHLANPKVGTKASITQMMTPFMLTNGRSTGYGFGLFMDAQNGQKRVQHGGADVSHRSMLAIYPDLNAGITVQSNDGNFDSNIAFMLAEQFFPELKPKPQGAVAKTDSAGKAVNFDPKAFDAFVGEYAIDARPTFVISFTRAGDTLFTQATGQPKIRMVASSDTSFALQGVAASVEFVRDASRKAVAAILVQNGARQRASRKTNAIWTPTTAEWAGITGRYFSEELETFWELMLVNGKPVMRGRRTEDQPLTITAKDTFTDGGSTTLVLERDRAGRVIGLYAGNQRSRDIRFERLR